MKRFLLISIFSLPSFLFSQITQGFDGPNVPTNWRVSYFSDFFNTWKIYTSYSVSTATFLPHSGAGFVGIESSRNSYNYNESLNAPALKLGSTGNSVISFWARNSDSTKPIRFTVYISEGNKSSIPYEIFSGITAPSEWTLYTKTIPATYAGRTIYTSFQISAPYYNSFLGIDDFNMTNAILGVKDLKDSLNFKIYPNPVKDILNLQNDASDNITKLEIFNLVGQLVRKQEGNDIDKVDVSDLAKGIYLLKLESKNEQNFTMKFTKE